MATALRQSAGIERRRQGMSKKSGLEEVQQLIDMGKEKGYLTFDEVNDLLPPDMVSSDQLDDVMSMFGEMDIEVVDSEQKIALRKDRALDEELEEGEEEEEEFEAEPLAEPAIRCACTCPKWARSPCLPGRARWNRQAHRGRGCLVTSVIMKTPSPSGNHLARREARQGQISVAEVTKEYEEEEGAKRKRSSASHSRPGRPDSRAGRAVWNCARSWPVKSPRMRRKPSKKSARRSRGKSPS
jgi:RNA polymerase primary sigma factor